MDRGFVVNEKPFTKIVSLKYEKKETFSYVFRHFYT